MEGHFLGDTGQRLFVLHRPARGASKGCVLVVPPFGEEMNKSRRMLSETGERLAGLGWHVVLPDLFGTGDSEGDFGEADWARWRQDLAATAAWCAAGGWPVTALLAVRLGAALAADALEGSELLPVARTVLWQPTFDGQRFLTQFLRLRVAASMMDSDRKESVAGLRAKLAAGNSLEVAGYTLAARLAAAIDAVEAPASLSPAFGRLHWLEVVSDRASALPIASTRIASAERKSNGPAEILGLVGDPFWSSTEIVSIPAVVETTVAVLMRE